MIKKDEIGNIADNTVTASRNSRSLSLEAEDEVSLKNLFIKMQEWWHYLLGKWLFILIAGIIGGALGFVYATMQKTNYVATLSFVLEDEKSSNLGNLGGLAAIAGFNLGGGAQGIFQGNNIFELYKSRTMLTKTLLTKTTQNDSLFIDRYLSLSKLKENWNENIHLKNISFSIPQQEFTLQHDSIIGLVVKTIREKNLHISNSDKTGSLIQVETKSLDENFSKDFTEAIVENVNDFYLETRTKKSFQNLSILQNQTDSIRKELNAAIGGVAAAVEANPNANPARRSLNVASLRREVDVQANQAILTELVKNLEMAKISLRQETPLIQIIDRPVLPLKVEKFSKLKGLIYGGFLFGLLTVIYFMLKKYLSEIFERNQ